MKCLKIVIAGGSGFIGSYLSNYFQKNHNVIILTRKVDHYINNIKYVHWDGINISTWVQELEGCDILINLAGKNIKCLFTKINKKKLLESRINSVRVLNRAMYYIKTPPKLWIQASSIGFYGNTKKICSESSKKGDTFLANLVEKWENSLFEYKLYSTRKIILRFGLALHYSGGILENLVKFTKKISGVYISNKTIYMSWFHLFDLIRIINFLFEKNIYISNNIFNVCSPYFITNKNFMEILRIFFNKSYIFPIPSYFFEFFSKFLLRIEPEFILSSQQVIPKKLLDLGFNFYFDKLEKIFSDLYYKK